MRTEAAHLTDRVFPRQPVRWWVLGVTKLPRYFMLRERSLVNMVRRIFLRVIKGMGSFSQHQISWFVFSNMLLRDLLHFCNNMRNNIGTWSSHRHVS
jgi:hypothetical protein